jgi:hypothetical protein
LGINRLYREIKPMGEAGTKRGSAAPWEIVDMATVPADILSLYNEMKIAYEGGKENEYVEARERFYHAMMASITLSHAVRPDQKVSIKFTPAMVQVAITPRKEQGRNGIVKGTFRLGELPSKVRRLGANPL